MKKLNPIKLFLILISLALITTTLFFAVSYSRAEDDNEREYENGGETENYTPAPVVPTPISTPAPIIDNNQPPSSQADNSALIKTLIDTDQDGIPNVSDQHPGQDDFSYNLVDNNQNGIADDLEKLLK